MIEELIDSAVIVESLSGSSVDGVLSEVLEAIVAAGQLGQADSKTIGKQLREREKLGSTGIGNGVAVPHVKTTAVDSIRLALARSQSGIEYQAIDGRPVHTLFMILAPEDQADAHLQALRWVSGLARNADFRRFVLSTDGEDAIRDLLREMSS